MNRDRLISKNAILNMFSFTTFLLQIAFGVSIILNAKKSGGKYVTATGTVKKIDKFKQFIVLYENKEIPINEVIEILVDKD